jgi:ribonuclease HI
VKPSRRDVLEALAESLDIAAVLERYPALGRDGLKALLRDEAEGRTGSPPPAAAAGKLVAYVDGAARGNPGKAGAGVVIRDASDNVIEKQSLFLGEATNNTAEYKALLLALRRARELGASALQVYSDSELLVHQINGRYRIRASHLQSLCQEAIRLMKDIGTVDVSHISRENNSDADEMANRAIDEAPKG